MYITNPYYYFSICQHFTYHVLGDSTYPLKSYLLKPFPKTKLKLDRIKNYNSIHATARVAVKNVHIRLKKDWCRLQVINTNKVERAELLCRACFVLHNFILQHDKRSLDTIKPRQYRPPVHDGNAIRKREDISRKLKVNRL